MATFFPIQQYHNLQLRLLPHEQKKLQSSITIVFHVNTYIFKLYQTQVSYRMKSIRYVILKFVNM